MNEIIENIRTNVGENYDVIVIGGGPAGACAAIGAARKGSKVLLVERCGYLGGMWTGGFVNPLFDFQYKKGLIREIQKKLEDNGVWGGFWGICFQYEPMKILLEDLVKNAGGEILYYTNFSRAIVENNRVLGIIVDNIEGRTAYHSKVVIDCTGDAQVAFNAGVNTIVGREKDGLCQSMTLMFTIGNVDFKQENKDELYDLVEKALKQNDTGYRLPFNNPYIIQIPNSKTAVVQLTHMRGYDPINAFSISEAVIEGRKQATAAVEFFKENIPQLHEIELLQTAPLIGVRESRRIVGEYTVTIDDLTAGKRFEDGICEVRFNVDIHEPDSNIQNCHQVEAYDIPYRSLIPKNFEGLLVAGRCISGTHEAMASYRVTGNCAEMGEAAGIAAAVSAKENISLRLVDVKKHIIQNR